MRRSPSTAEALPALTCARCTTPSLTWVEDAVVELNVVPDIVAVVPSATNIAPPCPHQRGHAVKA